MSFHTRGISYPSLIPVIHISLSTIHFEETSFHSKRKHSKLLELWRIGLQNYLCHIIKWHLSCHLNLRVFKILGNVVIERNACEKASSPGLLWETSVFFSPMLCFCLWLILLIFCYDRGWGKKCVKCLADHNISSNVTMRPFFINLLET